MFSIRATLVDIEATLRAAIRREKVQVIAAPPADVRLRDAPRKRHSHDYAHDVSKAWSDEQDIVSYQP